LVHGVVLVRFFEEDASSGVLKTSRIRSPSVRDQNAGVWRALPSRHRHGQPVDGGHLEVRDDGIERAPAAQSRDSVFAGSEGHDVMAFLSKESRHRPNRRLVVIDDENASHSRQARKSRAEHEVVGRGDEAMDRYAVRRCLVLERPAPRL
jgi:hypothetical protein